MWHSQEQIDSFKRREQKACEVIKSKGLQNCTVGVFGSYARGNYTVMSDIDICIITDEVLPRIVKGELSEELELLGCDATFILKDYFVNGTDRFAQELRQDFREVKI